uniref:Uncharacterized protein n=1 Tax=Oryza punctata TaxID=4537 RepID=A0A0E0M8I8_ORYPU
MVFLLGLYGGGSRRRTDATGGGGRRRLAVAAPRPVRQLYRKLRSKWRSALRPGKKAGGAAGFGYDLQSYSRNFDDGIMAFLPGLYGGGGGGGGGRRRTNEIEKGGAERRRRLTVAAQRPVRQLYRKLRSRWSRSSASWPSRKVAGGAARFGYDLESYSRNFNDGLASLAPIPS